MEDKSIKSKQIFNYLFEKAQEEGIPLSPMKAIKLVYFCHAWYLGFRAEPLLNEPVQAWKYGAVVPSLYHDLKIYGAGDIKYPILKNQQEHYLDIYLDNEKAIDKAEKVSPKGLTEDEKTVIDSVWNGYKQLDAARLSGIMHQPGTPWTQIWNNGNCRMGAVIPNDLIEKYYKALIEAEARKRNG